MNLALTVAAQSDGATSDEVIAFLIFMIGIFLPVAAMLWLGAKVLSNAGHAWPWTFILLVPVVNLVMVILFVFSEWPVRRELALTQLALAEATGTAFPGNSPVANYGPAGYPHAGYQGEPNAYPVAPYGQQPQQPPYGFQHQQTPSNSGPYGPQPPAPYGPQPPAPYGSQPPAPYGPQASDSGTGYEYLGVTPTEAEVLFPFPHP